MSTQNGVKIESIVMDDGRRAERHTTFDANGNKVVEIFAEEKRPLKLENRVVQEMKQVVAKEIRQQVRDGQVVVEEVVSTEPDAPLQLRSRIATADHAKVFDGDYIRKEEISELIADSVVAGVTAMMENMQPVVSAHSVAPAAVHAAPTVSAQSIIEKNLEKKTSNEMLINIGLVLLIVGQVAFLGWKFFM